MTNRIPLSFFKFKEHLIAQFSRHFPLRNAEHSTEDFVKWLQWRGKAKILKMHSRGEKSLNSLKYATNYHTLSMFPPKSIRILLPRGFYLRVAHRLFNEKVPFEYIINSCFFYNRNFYVNENVLICRQDSEVLIDCLKGLLTRDNTDKQSKNILSTTNIQYNVQSSKSLEMSSCDSMMEGIAQTLAEDANRSLSQTIADQLIQGYIEANLSTKCSDWNSVTLPKPNYIIDLCSGSGCLLLTILLEFPCIKKAIGVDISKDALKIAEVNSRLHISSENKFKYTHGMYQKDDSKTFHRHLRKEKRAIAQPTWINASIFEVLQVQCLGQADYIISNPPYIPSSEIENLDVEVKNHEPRIALDGGDDGLDFYKFFAEHAHKSLHINGILILELGIEQSEVVKQIFLQNNYWKWIETRKDWSEIDRVICFQRVL